MYFVLLFVLKLCFVGNSKIRRIRCFVDPTAKPVVTGVNGKSLPQREFSRRTISNSRRVKSLRHPGCMHYACTGMPREKCLCNRKRGLRLRARRFYLRACRHVSSSTSFRLAHKFFNIVALRASRNEREFFLFARNHAPFGRNCKRFVQRANRSEVIG